MTFLALDMEPDRSLVPDASFFAEVRRHHDSHQQICLPFRRQNQLIQPQ